MSGSKLAEYGLGYRIKAAVQCWRKPFTKLADALFGRCCPNCGHRTLEASSYQWARGWNELCKQASGDDGQWCKTCRTIIWRTSLEVWESKIPRWVRPYTGTFYARTFPDPQETARASTGPASRPLPGSGRKLPTPQ